MIRTSKKPVAWPLPWDSEVQIMLRAGDVIERGEFEALLSENGAGRVFDFQLREEVVRGAESLAADDTEALNRVRECLAAEEASEELTVADADFLSTVRELLQRNWGPYRVLLARSARRNELIPTLAFQHFCTGWSGKDLPAFKKGIDGLVSLDVVGQLDEMIVRVAGMEAYRQLYAAGQEKNSEGLSLSGESPEASSSNTSKAAGSSEKTGGRKTRSSRSRPGVSAS